MRQKYQHQQPYKYTPKIPQKGYANHDNFTRSDYLIWNSTYIDNHNDLANNWLILDKGFSFAWHTMAVLAFNDAKQVATCRQFLQSRTMIELGKWREMGLWWVWHGYRWGIRWGMMGYSLFIGFKAWLLHTSSILFPHSDTLKYVKSTHYVPSNLPPL